MINRSRGANSSCADQVIFPGADSKPNWVPAVEFLNRVTLPAVNPHAANRRRSHQYGSCGPSRSAASTVPPPAVRGTAPIGPTGWHASHGIRGRGSGFSSWPPSLPIASTNSASRPFSSPPPTAGSRSATFPRSFAATERARDPAPGHPVNADNEQETPGRDHQHPQPPLPGVRVEEFGGPGERWLGVLVIAAGCFLLIVGLWS